MAYFGMYIGVVSAAGDPQQSGRVQVRVPALGTTAWAVVSTPIGSVTSGSVPAGANVVVAFERGDPGRPVVLGRVQSLP